MIQEKDYPAMPGGPMLAVLLLALAGDISLFVLGFWVGLWLIIAAAVLFPIIPALFAGLFAVPPNEARALQWFGRYVGAAQTPGLRYANPHRLGRGAEGGDGQQPARRAVRRQERAARAERGAAPVGPRSRIVTSANIRAHSEPHAPISLA